MTESFDMRALHAAVGRYLSNVASIESYLDLTIESEFHVLLPDETRRFRTWVTSNLSFRAKAHAAMAILDHHGVLQHDRTLRKELDHIVGRRDFLAHAQLIPSVKRDASNDLRASWTLEFQQARGDRGIRPAEAATIEAEADTAQEIGRRVSALMKLQIDKGRGALPE